MKKNNNEMTVFVYVFGAIVLLLLVVYFFSPCRSGSSSNSFAQANSHHHTLGSPAFGANPIKLNTPYVLQSTKNGVELNFSPGIFTSSSQGDNSGLAHVQATGLSNTPSPSSGLAYGSSQLYTNTDYILRVEESGTRKYWFFNPQKNGLNATVSPPPFSVQNMSPTFQNLLKNVSGKFSFSMHLVGGDPSKKEAIKGGDKVTMYLGGAFHEKGQPPTQFTMAANPQTDGFLPQSSGSVSGVLGATAGGLTLLEGSFKNTFDRAALRVGGQEPFSVNNYQIMREVKFVSADFINYDQRPVQPGERVFIQQAYSFNMDESSGSPQGFNVRLGKNSEGKWAFMLGSSSNAQGFYIGGNMQENDFKLYIQGGGSFGVKQDDSFVYHDGGTDMEIDNLNVFETSVYPSLAQTSVPKADCSAAAVIDVHMKKGSNQSCDDYCNSKQSALYTYASQCPNLESQGGECVAAYWDDGKIYNCTDTPSDDVYCACAIVDNKKFS
jgi:hypothetical protein